MRRKCLWCGAELPRWRMVWRPVVGGRWFKAAWFCRSNSACLRRQVKW